jgi:hypothetical protein
MLIFACAIEFKTEKDRVPVIGKRDVGKYHLRYLLFDYIDGCRAECKLR